MSIEVRRRQEVNIVRQEIGTLEKAQQRDIENLKKLNTMKISKEIFDKKKATITADLDRREKEMIALQEKEKELLAGNLDKQMLTESKQNKVVHQTKTDAAKKKRQDVLKEDEEKKTKFFAKEKVNNRKDYFEKSDHSYFAKQFYKAIDTLPEHKQENLKEMPANKGYIWRSCWFFGQLPAQQGQPTTMFENAPGGVLIIHEFDDYEYRKYEKIGKDRKQLVLCQPRRKV